MGGGAERVVIRLLEAFESSVDELHLSVLWNEGPLRIELPDRVIFHDLACKRARHALPSLVVLIKKIKPDIVFTTLSRLNVLLLGAKFLYPRNTKLIIREANTPSAELKTLPGGRVYRKLYRWLYPLADAIICQSDYMKHDLTNNFGVPVDKTVRIYNPIPFRKIDKAVLGSLSPYESGILNFVSVGNLDLRKGYDLLIRSFSKIKDKLPKFRLTIVGDGQELKALQAQAVSEGMVQYIKFAGFQENPYIYCKHADIFISSSRYEGLPNVVLEAMACGTPVLATNCPGGTVEIVKNDINGWLVASENVKSMAEGILMAVNEKNKYTNEGVRLSVIDYSSEKIAKSYLDVFNAVL